MLTIPKNWTIVAYTDDTWTPLLTGEAAVITTLIITNPSATALTVSVRLATSTAVIIPSIEIAAGGTLTLEARSLSIPATDGIEVKASATGANFIASGAI